MKFPSSYELLKEQEINEIGASGYILKHKKSGARVFILEAEDDNKVFSIGFRTPPADDTGVPHIMEHSVLCGSDRFPLKDPFVELVKGSLNTYLNAMTYPEKTLYPVASMNDQDFKNLMAVYTDAVFHPNIYKTEMIFRQEGWHYDLKDTEDELSINGVVYNEMRGAYSDPDTVLERFNKAILLPDNCYKNESGGDPKAIPELTYEAFLDFHRRYYHPSNSYIYLYGRMDFSERLEWLDREYLCNYEEISPNSEIPDQQAFSEPVRTSVKVPAPAEEGVTFSYTAVTGGLMDPVRSLAYEVLGYALLNAPGAPIKQALLDAGIGTDIYGGYDDGLKQPLFSIVAKGAEAEDADRFLDIIRRVMKEQAENGISETTLRAGIHNIEFSIREADYGRYPKGLVYGLQAYDTWIHDDMSPMVHLAFDENFRLLKEKVGTGYFEELVLKDLLQNTHAAFVVTEPVEDLASQEEEALKAKLSEKKAQLSEEELAVLVKDTEALKIYQETSDDPEALRVIPLLQVSDIKRRVHDLSNEPLEICGIPAVFHEINSAGIGYVDMSFSMDSIPDEDLAACALLKLLLTQLSTENYTFQALNDEISLKTGAIGCDVQSYTTLKDEGIRIDFSLRGKTLYPDMADMLSLFNEIAFRTDFTDDKRLREIISEAYMEMQNSMVNSGHSTAMKRVLSYVSSLAKVDESLIGIDFYRYISSLYKDFDEQKETLKEKLQSLSKQIFRRDNLLISFAGSREGLQAFKEAFPLMDSALKDGALPAAGRAFQKDIRNEGFKSSSMVQYAAMGGNFLEKGYEFTGAMLVLKTLLGYEYLWQNIRVQGGAYGCMSYFGRDGEVAFVSYRDPNLKETLDIYKGIPAYLRELQLDNRQLTQYIIGTISEMDVPLTPSIAGRRSLTAFKRGYTEDFLQKNRDQILDCSAEDLKALADVIEAVLSDGAAVVVGASKKIEENREVFKEITTLQ